MTSRFSKDVSLPLRFMVMGLAFFLVSTVWLGLRSELLIEYHYGPEIIAITHALVLGFGASVVFGAGYQLVPVALETQLWSPRLARFHFWCHLVGVPGMVVMFRVWNMKQVGHFGSAFALGVFAFAWNLWKTIRLAPRRDVVSYGVGSAGVWLVLATCAGLFLASAKCWPPINPLDPLAGLHAHAHLGVLGGFVTLIVAVSYRLVPMFLLSEVAHPRRARASLHLLNLGLLGLIPSIALKSTLKPAFTLVVIAGLALFATEIAAMLRARKRRHLDWGLLGFFGALSLLVPLALLATWLSRPGLPVTDLNLRLENAYALLAIYGVLGGAILGMLYKILPFLVWFRVYSGRIGRGKVPALQDLYSATLQPAGLVSYAGGVLVSAAGIIAGHSLLVQSGWLVVCFGLLLFAINAVLMLSHLKFPRGNSSSAIAHSRLSHEPTHP